MPATMDKKDVQISVNDPKHANWTQKWNEIQQCSGRKIPEVAKQSVKDALANPKYKKLAVKVGLIKTDLYLRIKNGSDHVQDIKLVPNWVAPQNWVSDGAGDDEEQDQDPEYQRKLQEWKQSKEHCKTLGEQVVQSLKRLAKEADDYAERARTEADRVFSGADTMNDALPNARRMAQELQNHGQEAETVYQRYFVEFDKHRTAKGEEFKPEDREGYDMPFFMQVLKPIDKNAVALKESITNHFVGAQAAVAQIQAFQQNGAQQAYLAMAQHVHQQADNLLQKSRNVLGAMTGQISSLVQKGSGLAMDLDFVLQATTLEMKLANADKALQRMANIRDAAPRIDEYMAQGKALVLEANKIPKNLRAGQIKQELDAFTKSVKDLAIHQVEWHKHADTAEKLYKEILKRVNK
jgi:hypothetical protein